jgi:hypothetical protein
VGDVLGMPEVMEEGGHTLSFKHRVACGGVYA